MDVDFSMIGHMYARIGCWFDCEMIISMCTQVGNSPCRIYLYWALAHPVVGPPLSGTGQVQADDAPERPGL